MIIIIGAFFRLKLIGKMNKENSRVSGVGELLFHLLLIVLTLFHVAVDRSVNFVVGGVFTGLNVKFSRLIQRPNPRGPLQRKKHQSRGKWPLKCSQKGERDVLVISFYYLNKQIGRLAKQQTLIK